MSGRRPARPVRKFQTALSWATFAFISLLLVPAILPPSFCWSNGGFSSDPLNPKYGTHDWIAEHALDWLPLESKQWLLSYRVFYLYGTELPDNSQATDGIGDTRLHHIYFYADGRLMDASSAVRANATYRQALNYMLEGDFASAAKYTGAMTHYIADMAVFGHVMGNATPWGEETHHGDYENYVNSKTSGYDAEFNVSLQYDGKLEVITAYDAAVMLAYDTTFDSSGRGLTCVWMDQNYDWNNPLFRDRAGESLNLAVNYVADVLSTLYMEYKNIYPYWNFSHIGDLDIGGVPYPVWAASNSTITNFNFNGTAFWFNVTGREGTWGWCNLTIPAGLNRSNYVVFTDSAPLTVTVICNGTHYLLRFTYLHSERRITVTTEGEPPPPFVPELPLPWASALAVVAALALLAYERRRRKNKPRKIHDS